MAKTLKHMMRALPPDGQRRVEERAAQLITLEYVRRSAALTQTGLARKMGVGQHAVSRLEARSDMLVSTLRRYVESAGGELDLRVRLPGRRKPVSLNALG